MQFVETVDHLLEVFLSWEALPNGQSRCPHCTGSHWAVWRCQDCSFPTALCQHCMCNTHWENPMHRIQRWTGTHFQSPQLWEVGAYILVPHRNEEKLCETLEGQKLHLENFEQFKDEAKQTNIWESVKSRELAHNRESASPQFEHPWNYGNDPFRTQSVSWDQETPDDNQRVDNETFKQFLQDIHQHQNNLHPTDQVASLGRGLTQQLASTNFDPNNQSTFSNACMPLEEADDNGRWIFLIVILPTSLLTLLINPVVILNLICPAGTHLTTPMYELCKPMVSII